MRFEFSFHTFFLLQNIVPKTVVHMGGNGKLIFITIEKVGF